MVREQLSAATPCLATCEAAWLGGPPRGDQRGHPFNTAADAHRPGARDGCLDAGSRSVTGSASYRVLAT